MPRLVAAFVAVAVLASLPLGCSCNDDLTVGTTGGVSGSAGAGKAGSSAGASGGGVGGGSVGGGEVGTGGWASRTMTTGGAGGTAGGAPAATGGSSPGGGGAGGGDKGGAGGAPGTCTGCQPQESCWSDGLDARCVATGVHLPSGVTVDATEVTREQYSAWLVTHPAATGQAAVCDWNTSFIPEATCMAQSSVCQGTTCATHPQPCIDQCDATAYCQAIGKRLCAQGEWTNACSANGAYPAGYGVNLVMGTCNDYTAFGATTVPVASKRGCQSPAGSGFEGVFDMIGNLAEWVDDCSPAGGAADGGVGGASGGAGDSCKPRGLSFGSGAAAPLCSQSTYAPRSMVYPNLGFRCCSS